jgi:hypothetical protein
MAVVSICAISECGLNRRSRVRGTLLAQYVALVVGVSGLVDVGSIRRAALA